MRQIIFYTQKKLFCFRILQIFEKILQIPGIGQRETAAAGPAQRGEVGAAVERLADLAGQRTDVGPLAAPSIVAASSRALGIVSKKPFEI